MFLDGKGSPSMPPHLSECVRVSAHSSVGGIEKGGRKSGERGGGEHRGKARERDDTGG